MPIYEFQCDDGHRFEQIFRVSVDSTYCESCDHVAYRMVSQASGAAFAQRTGNEDIDTLLGEDAEKRWATVGARQVERVRVRAVSGSEKLTVTDEGAVIPLSPEKLQLRKSVYSAYDVAQVENRVE